MKFQLIFVICLLSSIATSSIMIQRTIKHYEANAAMAIELTSNRINYNLERIANLLENKEKANE